MTAVSAPLNGISGQDVTVTWAVMNNGPLATFTDSWIDRVYLSLDDQFDASDKLIGSVEHDGALGVGGSYNGMLTAPLPGVVPAPYLARAHWVQVTDARALTDAQARELVTRSHALVHARLTRRDREAIAAAIPKRKTSR